MIKLGNNNIGKVYLGSNVIGTAYYGSNLVYRSGGTPTPPEPPTRLPDGFTELAYVATDSQAWVSTGVAGATDLEIITRFCVGSYVQYGAIYGNYIDESYKNSRCILYSQTQLLCAGGNNQSTTVSNFSLNRVHTVSVKSNEIYLEGNRTAITSDSKTTNTTTICLGNRSTTNTANRDLGLRIFSFIIKKSGTIILNYVPCSRDYDSAVGFYDLAADTFVKSLTGTEFVAGPVAVYSGELIKCLDWDGSNAPLSSKWFDTIGNQYYTINSGTYETDYYQFINSNPASSSQYAELFGALPDLGYHWKIVADVAIRTQSSNPDVFVPIDFGAMGNSGSGSSTVGVTFGDGYWGVNPKYDGQGSESTYGVTGDYHISQETITTSEEWIRRTIEFGVRASSESGKDETYIIVTGKGQAKTATPYTPIRLNRWLQDNYIGRSRVNPSSTYKYATSTRVYSLQVYYKPID